jgi:hypothetical protein
MASLLKVHSDLIQNQDAFGYISIPELKKESIRVVAEQLVMMISGRNYDLGEYFTITELEKKLTLDYWVRYDKLNNVIAHDDTSFRHWYIKATNASEIERAIRWLRREKLLLLDTDVEMHAHDAAKAYEHGM